MQINYNGKLVPAETPLFTAQNRSFRYGDGLFESIRVFNGKLPFLSYHWKRLTAGMAFLGLEKPHFYSPQFFAHEIRKLTNGQGNWRIRLTVWRSGGGLYTPEINLPEFLIEAIEMVAKSGGDLESPPDLGQFQLNEQGLKIGICPTIPPPLIQPVPPVQPIYLHESSISQFKLTSALPYVLAANFKKAHGLDDCLLLNTAGRLACASSANLFIVKNGRLLTPPLTEGCVAGTMRAALFDIAAAMKIKLLEKKIRLTDLAAADEILLTNAIQGIRWVQKVEGNEESLGHEIAKKMVEGLNQLIQK